jgi:hypothetical protein
VKITADDWAFIIPTIALVCVAGFGCLVYERMTPKVQQACSITFSDSAGNRHQFIGKGEVW